MSVLSQKSKKKELINATLKSIKKYGIQNTTSMSITKFVGMSPGIINHYFEGKDDLIYNAMKSVISNFRGRQLQEIKRAKVPFDKVKALIYANVHEGQSSVDTIKDWLVFWTESLHNDNLQKLRHIFLQRLRSNILYYLKKECKADVACHLCELLIALIHGFWLEMAFYPEQKEKLIRILDNSFTDLFYLYKRFGRI